MQPRQPHYNQLPVSHNPNHVPSSEPQPSYQQLSSSLQSIIQSAKQHMVQHNLINSQTDYESLFPSAETQPQTQHSNSVATLSNLINYLIASLIESKQHSESLVDRLNPNTQQNDKRVLQGLEIFVDLTQTMANFSKEVFKKRQEDKQLPVEICRSFRKVYELTEELSSVLNSYSMDNESFLERRDDLIAMQIRCMEDVFMDQEHETVSRVQQPSSQRYQQPKPTISPQTQTYIISLRQQICHLHQTLLKNDEQFTMQIQNYNKTLREMSATIKAYELQLANITNYELRIEELEKMIVRFREEKYRNEIVIENMAKKIRNFEKELRGDRAFLSPQRQRLVSSPQSKFSMLNSKLSSALSVVNSVNNSGTNLIINSPVRKSFF